MNAANDMNEATVLVEKPGFLSTLQDLGRPGLAHQGISASGAADALALRLGNLLLGNEENAPALEMTLVGGTFIFGGDSMVVLAGADFGAVLDSAPLLPWRATVVRRGGSIVLGAARGGARGYLCVRGGFAVPPVLGSASTHVLTGLGGLGRPLRAGDRLRLQNTDPPLSPLNLRWLEARRLDLRWLEEQYSLRPLRLTPGPQLDWFAQSAREKLGESDYEVLEQSNRMGLRLAGPQLERSKPGDLLTEGVSLGAIQVPENGQPIILFVEHQTTGGYPKIANVCSVDMHRLGQLRPRDRVRFGWVEVKEAHRLFMKREAVLTHLRLERRA